MVKCGLISGCHIRPGPDMISGATLLGSVQVVGFFDVAARLSAGDGPIAELVGSARSFLFCDERIQVTFPSSILSDYVHMKARYVFMVSVLCVRNCLVQRFC